MKLKVKKRNRTSNIPLSILLCLLLASCGGVSGSTEQSPTQTEISEWDVMEWDRNNWG